MDVSTYFVRSKNMQIFSEQMRDRQVEELVADIQDKDQQIATMQREMVNKDGQIATMDEHMTAMEGELANREERMTIFQDSTTGGNATTRCRNGPPSCDIQYRSNYEAEITRSGE